MRKKVFRTELWRRGTRHALAGRKCLVVNYDDDRQKCAEKPFTYKYFFLLVFALSLGKVFTVAL